MKTCFFASLSQPIQRDASIPLAVPHFFAALLPAPDQTEKRFYFSHDDTASSLIFFPFRPSRWHEFDANKCFFSRRKWKKIFPANWSYSQLSRNLFLVMRITALTSIYALVFISNRQWTRENKCHSHNSMLYVFFVVTILELWENMSREKKTLARRSDNTHDIIGETRRRRGCAEGELFREDTYDGLDVSLTGKSTDLAPFFTTFCSTLCIILKNI